MKPVLLLVGILVATSPFMGVTGCSQSDEAEVIPATVKTRMTYYAMPG